MPAEVRSPRETRRIRGRVARRRRRSRVPANRLGPLPRPGLCLSRERTRGARAVRVRPLDQAPRAHRGGRDDAVGRGDAALSEVFPSVVLARASPSWWVAFFYLLGSVGFAVGGLASCPQRVVSVNRRYFELEVVPYASGGAVPCRHDVTRLHVVDRAIRRARPRRAKNESPKNTRFSRVTLSRWRQRVAVVVRETLILVRAKGRTRVYARRSTADGVGLRRRVGSVVPRLVADASSGAREPPRSGRFARRWASAARWGTPSRSL